MVNVDIPCMEHFLSDATKVGIFGKFGPPIEIPLHPATLIPYVRRMSHFRRHRPSGDSPVDSQSVEVRDQFCTRARGPVQRADERVLETDEPAQEAEICSPKGIQIRKRFPCPKIPI